MSKDWYYINSIEDFVNSARALVFYFFGSDDTTVSAHKSINDMPNLSIEEQQELDSCLSFNEAVLIVKQRAKKQTHKKSKQERYCINDAILQSIIEDLNSRMVSNILNNLVNQGVLDTGYDIDINDFVFWVKDDETSNEKPETD